MAERAVFRFPNPVNELAARTVAGGVLLQCVATLVLTLTVGPGWFWLTVPLAYGFVARVAAGPRFSPLGQLATRVLAPRLGPARPVAGPPKRFAQLMGAALSLTALVLGLVLGLAGAAQIVLALIVVAASLESVFGYCLGCVVFGALMRAGVIPAEVCADCADITSRVRPAEVQAH
jgi:hypothetical protein